MFELHNDIIDKLSPRQSQTLVDVAVPLNLLSVIFNLLVILIFAIFHSLKSHLVNRVSLRLTFAVATVDLFYSAFQIVSDVTKENEFLCALSVWGFIQTTHLSTFLTVMIAFNLQVIFVHGKRQTQKYEKYYYSIAGLLSLAISLPPLLSGRLGHDSYQESCWYSIHNPSERMVWTWATLYSWTMLGIFYCFVVVLMVLIKIARERQDRRRFFSNSLIIQSTMNKVVRRVILYPIIPVLTQSFNLISELDIYWNQRVNYTFLLLSFIGTSSQGILNAAIFFVDPAVQNAWAELKDDLIFQYHIQQPQAPEEVGGCSPSINPRHPRIAVILRFVVRKVLLSQADTKCLLQSNVAESSQFSGIEPLRKVILRQSKRQSFLISPGQCEPYGVSESLKEDGLNMDEDIPFARVHSSLTEENISLYFYQSVEYRSSSEYVFRM
ncbi:hypothetical protein K493DRAFT_360740 [Basidiobolus meristosporus CBS 931.73]|uniref:G-protein coupled receptors family 2 profile 2 domain-containing protein n=1 Tax=Basidiobolus meristosporus CBS 931.73 TaxID=1314790 RepID=A0A1Y1XFX1_9FUNG|nr:hypothetical protein K493DRAFT_360740 [Basidiobolus meristosporus CBS 931.73]|eukprot:ORX84306.1 hypothetical protein K493DRAFT_360740 [Basidiobolus meristosporus CBS 931.73]